MKKAQIASLYALSWVMVFFAIFLYPLFVVRYFTNPTAYIFFRVISGITSLMGIYGIGAYLYIFAQAIKIKKLDRPVLWLQLSLVVACITLLVGFLIPITFSS